MTDIADVVEAQASRQVARQRFLTTFDEVKTRLSPATIAQDAVESATDGAKTLVRKRPVAVAGTVAAIGLFFARGLIRRKLAERRAAHATAERPTS
jgi:ElaB/YqjD/DUF883 family membrane-anchored ribosome-binding protein